LGYLLPVVAVSALSTRGKRSPKRRGGATRRKPKVWTTWLRGGESDSPKKSSPKATRPKKGKALGKREKKVRLRIPL